MMWTPLILLSTQFLTSLNEGPSVFETSDHILEDSIICGYTSLGFPEAGLLSRRRSDQAMVRPTTVNDHLDAEMLLDKLARVPPVYSSTSADRSKSERLLLALAPRVSDYVLTDAADLLTNLNETEADLRFGFPGRSLAREHKYRKLFLRKRQASLTEAQRSCGDRLYALYELMFNVPQTSVWTWHGNKPRLHLFEFVKRDNIHLPVAENVPLSGDLPERRPSFERWSRNSRM